MPEIEVGAMLVEDELLEGVGGSQEGRCGVVPVGGGVVLQRNNVGWVEHLAATSMVPSSREGA